MDAEQAIIAGQKRLHENHWCVLLGHSIDNSSADKCRFSVRRILYLMLGEKVSITSLSDYGRRKLVIVMVKVFWKVKYILWKNE